MVVAPSKLIDRPQLAKEMRAWSIPCAVCALPSLIFAIMAGYHWPSDLLAMATGIALSWVAMAGGHSLRVVRATERLQRALDAFRWTARAKSRWIAVGLATQLLFLGVHEALSLPMHLWEYRLLVPCTAALWVDMWTGGALLDEAVKADRWTRFRVVGPPHSYSWTLVVTLLQGTAISIGLGVLCLVVLGWRRIRNRPVIGGAAERDVTPASGKGSSNRSSPPQ